MAITPVPRVRLPTNAKVGDKIEIKTLISHDMENGQRRDASGNIIPRKILNNFSATFNGKLVFKADWYPAVSANPYQSFFFKVSGPGKFIFTWVDDDGSKYTSEQELTVAS